MVPQPLERGREPAQEDGKAPSLGFLTCLDTLVPRRSSEGIAAAPDSRLCLLDGPGPFQLGTNAGNGRLRDPGTTPDFAVGDARVTTELTGSFGTPVGHRKGEAMGSVQLEREVMEIRVVGHIDDYGEDLLQAEVLGACDPVQPVEWDQATALASDDDRGPLLVTDHKGRHMIRHQSGDAGLHGRFDRESIESNQYLGCSLNLSH